jgi:SAM-dependent methyltransferase
MPLRNYLVDNKEIQPEVKLDRVPRNVSYLAGGPDEAADTATVGLEYVPEYFHVLLSNPNEENYYQDYRMSAFLSDKGRRWFSSQIDKLIRLHGSNPRSFLDVGCGEGDFLGEVAKVVSHCVGIEPSEVLAERARLKGLNVINGYVSSDLSPTAETFDLFACKQVFEHLMNPVDAMLGIRRMLAPNAVGVIDVPNGFRALREGRFFEFFPDHVSYYSVNSMVGLATRCGFNVLECGPVFDDADYLELWVRNEVAPQSYLGLLVEKRSTIVREVGRALQDRTDRGMHVGIWGAGAKGTCMIPLLPREVLERIDGVIDSDPYKHGRYVPDTPLQVMAPSDERARRLDCIFISNLLFVREVTDHIKAHLPRCREVLSLTEDGKVRVVVAS